MRQHLTPKGHHFCFSFPLIVPPTSCLLMNNFIIIFSVQDMILCVLPVRSRGKVSAVMCVCDWKSSDNDTSYGNISSMPNRRLWCKDTKCVQLCVWISQSELWTYFFTCHIVNYAREASVFRTLLFSWHISMWTYLCVHNSSVLKKDPDVLHCWH